MDRNYEPKPIFVERMKKLLGEDYEKYWEKIKEEELKSIRVNTLKISVDDLITRLKKKSWKIKQPFEKFPEIIIIESELSPGELGRSIEHLLGYYYIQELASMMPVIALNPKENELVLDLCAAPGSKTTQISATMKNTGTIIANDPSLGRIKILASNLERCGSTNTIITRKQGEILCKKLKEADFKFDKILVDAPCSGEGTIRSTPKTLLMWNIKTVESLSRMQKNLLSNAIELLKPKGEIVYSTCTHSPEENEEIIDFILKKFPNMEVEKINLPIKCSQGIKNWENKSFDNEITKTCRVYPHISNTEGFFIAKLKEKK